VEPLDVSDSPYGHKMPVCVLLKADKLGVSFYVGKTRPVYSVELCVPPITRVTLIASG